VGCKAFSSILRLSFDAFHERLDEPFTLSRSGGLPLDLIARLPILRLPPFKDIRAALGCRGKAEAVMTLCRRGP